MNEQQMLKQGAKRLIERADELAELQELKGTERIDYVTEALRTAYEQWTQGRRLAEHKARMR